MADFFKKTIINANWLQENKQDPKLIVLDASINKVGGKGDTAPPSQIGIPGTRFFDLKNKFSNQQSSLPNTIPTQEDFSRECQTLGINKDSKIVVYDKTGIYSSPRTWWLFKAMGHDNVAVLDGGLPEWIRAGGALAENDLNYGEKPGNFKAELKKEWLVNAQQVLSNITTEECLVLDARSAGRFAATAPEPRAGLRGGHIPKSKSLPYTVVLTEGKFKSPEKLKQIFDQFDPGEKRVIYSCGSGITACIILLAATIAGYNKTSVFDGSWTEWAEGDYPISS